MLKIGRKFCFTIADCGGVNGHQFLLTRIEHGPEEVVQSSVDIIKLTLTFSIDAEDRQHTDGKGEQGENEEENDGGNIPEDMSYAVQNWSKLVMDVEKKYHLQKCHAGSRTINVRANVDWMVTEEADIATSYGAPCSILASFITKQLQSYSSNEYKIHGKVVDVHKLMPF